MGRGAVGERERDVGVGPSCPALLLLAVGQLCHGGGQDSLPALQDHAPGLALLCSHKTELTCGLQCWLQALHATEMLGGFCFRGRSDWYCWEVLTLVYPNPPTLGRVSGRQLSLLCLHHCHPNTLGPPPHDPADLGPTTPCTVPAPACSCKTQLPPEGYSQHSLKPRRTLLSPSSPLEGTICP